MIVLTVDLHLCCSHKAYTDFVGLFCGLMSQSTTVVMLRQFVNLTTLFLDRLRPRQFITSN